MNRAWSIAAGCSLYFLGLYTGVGMIIAGLLRTRPEALQLGRQHSSLGA